MYGNLDGGLGKGGGGMAKPYMYELKLKIFMAHSDKGFRQFINFRTFNMFSPRTGICYTTKIEQHLFRVRLDTSRLE